MIRNIQVLRGLAALSVVFLHTAYPVPGLRQTDFLGVPIFFVISGFIMTYITRRSAHQFLSHRIIRIVPMYWLGTALYASMVVFIYPLIGKTTLDLVTTQTLWQDFLFIPRFEPDGTLIHPVLNVGWTLNIEMMFYLLFAAAIAINVRLAPALVAFVLIASWIVAAIFAFVRFLAYFGFDLNFYFVFGIIAFYIWDSPVRSRSLGALVTLGGMVALAGFMVTSNGVAALLAPPLIVLGALLLESSGLACPWTFPVFLGAASYSLYLFHSFVNGGVKALSGRFPQFDASHHLAPVSLCLLLSIALAAIVYKWVEAPLIAALRRHLEGRRPRQSMAADAVIAESVAAPYASSDAAASLGGDLRLQ